MNGSSTPMTAKKAADVDWKVDAGEGSAEGIFSGYAAIFGNVDSYGDVILKGAFADSLGEGGAGIPCYWGHRMDDPMLNIGVTTKAEETDRGLLVDVQLDMDNPNAAYVHRLIKTGRVKQMSFAFDVLDGGWGERDGERIYELRKLKLHEVSVVPIGANQETELIAAKARHEAADNHKSSAAPASEPAAEQEQVETGGHPAVVLANITLNSF